MADQQHDELKSLVREAVAKEVRAAAEHVTTEEAEANTRIRERLTALETELKIYRWIAGIVLALTLALLRFWPR